jgi:hypothetical protein
MFRFCPSPGLEGLKPAIFIRLFYSEPSFFHTPPPHVSGGPPSNPVSAQNALANFGAFRFAECFRNGALPHGGSGSLST